MTFRGTFDYTLDAKNRLTVPAKFRPRFADGVVLAKGLKTNIGIWVPSEFDAYVDKVLADFHPLSEEFETLNDFFSGGSLEVELDAAGRVGLSPRLLDHANLQKDVVITGARNRLEVWDRGAWDARDAGLTGQVKAITANLSGAGPTLVPPTRSTT